MNNKKTMIVLVLAFVLLIGGAYLLYDKLGSQVDAPQLGTQDSQSDQSQDASSQPDSSEEETPLAPDFTAYDLEGNPVKLSDFRGKPVVLNFWASWCGPCKSEMPDFDAAYAQYGEEVHFLMVNMTDGSQETLESASTFAADSGYSFPVYYDTESSAAIAYGVYSLPTTYFIDAEGYGVAYANTALSLELLEQGIGMILDS